MAESVWYGLNSGNEGNWNTAANWVGGVPGAGDYGMFMAGSQSVTTGPAASPTIDGIWVSENYYGNGGDANAFLTFGQIVEGVTINGNGQWYIDCSAAAGPTDGVIMRSAGTVGQLHLKVGTGATDLDLMILERGTLTLYAGTVVKTVLDHRSDLRGDAHLILKAGTLTTLYKEGGRFDMEAGTVTTLESYQGTVNINGGTVTLFKISHTRLVWATTVTLPEGHVHSGATFDASSDPRDKTITQLYRYGSGIVNLDTGRDSIIETNLTIEYGGAIGVKRFTV